MKFFRLLAAFEDSSELLHLLPGHVQMLSMPVLLALFPNPFEEVVQDGLSFGGHYSEFWKL
jgi:hypothetical protein